MLTRALVLSAIAPLLLGWTAIDGDTIRGERGERVRIENIDAPELAHPQCDAERRLARVAQRELMALLASGPVEIHAIPRKDRYGRTLARVSVSGRDVGETLVNMDLARPWRGKREPWCH